MAITRGLSAGAALALALIACSRSPQPAATDTPIAPSSQTKAAATAGRTSITPSSGCQQAMQAAAAEPDSARADPLIRATLDECSSADEWLAALNDYPGAMGLTAKADIGDRELQSACYGSEHRTVCLDAKASGRL